MTQKDTAGSPAALPGARDSVDRLVAEWQAVRPELDFSPVEIVTRVRRLRTFFEARLEQSLAACGLTGPMFAVLSTLRRQGPPFRVSQRALMDHLALTSGTVSVRVDQLVQLGLVTRLPDPDDRRGALVELTQLGLERCDACTPAYLADQERLITALTEAERRQVADLLRRLLAAFESEHDSDAADACLGLVLEPAHVARERQRELGLRERPGLLVRGVRTASAAEQAGIRAGDVLVRVNGRELRSVITLANALSSARHGPAPSVRLSVVRGAQSERRVELRFGPPL